jgi:hypothetical protein
MPHTYSLQNVPSSVAAGEAHYHHLLAGAAEARRFVPERTYHAADARTVVAVRHILSSSASAYGSRARRRRQPRPHLRPYQEPGDWSTRMSVALAGYGERLR